MAERTSTALRRAFRVAPALARGLGVTLALAVVGTALQIVVPITVQQIIDRDILGAGGPDPGAVIRSGAVATAAVLLAALARRTSLARLARSAATGLADLRVAAFERLHRLSALHLQGERRGALVGRVTSDVETMQAFMEWGGVGLLLGSAQILLALVVMVVYSWQLAAVVAVGTAVYAALLIWFQRLLRAAHDRVRGTVADAMGSIGEATAGLPTIRAFGIEAAMREKVQSAIRRQFDAEYRTAALGAALFSSAELFSGVLTAGVVVVGVLQGPRWGVTAGTLLAFLFLVNLLVEPVQMLVETINQAQSAGAGLRKVLGVLDTPEDVPDPGTGPEPPPGPLAVDVDDVRFAYPTGDEVLHGISVRIEPGRRIAVVGETGSGKTTFAKLVARLVDPTSGSISLSGVSVDRIPFAVLRRRVTYVPQEGFLFEGTIADNVRYGDPDATDDRVLATMEALGLGGWIAGLPEGLGTEVGERGSSLSAGERQLVAVARAAVTEPDLLILDEATSAVDPALEVQLRHAIETLSAGRTSITIAHRLSTAEAADEVLVFADGALVERGPHARLLAEDGVYAALHRDWEGAS